MQLIALSENVLVNVDQIETIQLRKINDRKTVVVTIGGQSYIPDDDFNKNGLPILLSKSPDLARQFFSI